MSVTVKKLKLKPVGDKAERDRVYKYIHDGQYNQALCMNSLMSQVGIAYYAFRRDVKCEEFKEEMKRIMRKENYVWDEYDLPKGLGSQSMISQQLRSDFSTALKNGLARGKRTLPQYKLSYPLLVPGRLISVYSADKEFTNKDGELVTTKAFYIKFPNKIRFEVILGSKGKRDSALYTVLSGLSEQDNLDYQIAGSSIGINDKKDIIINLSIKTEDVKPNYSPVKGRTMAVSFGYAIPCTCVFSDIDKKIIKIGERYSKEFIKVRQNIQARYQDLQAALVVAKGGKGRSHKLKKLNSYKRYEKNMARTYNHKLSSEIVEAAVKNNAEAIVIEKISKQYLSQTMLRNWSYYQLVEFIKYKAKRHGIAVIEASEKKDVLIWSTCSLCGAENKEELEIPKELVWGTNINYCCKSCKKNTEFSINKARNMVNLLKEITAKDKDDEVELDE